MPHTYNGVHIWPNALNLYLSVFENVAIQWSNKTLFEKKIKLAVNILVLSVDTVFWFELQNQI